jgi:hypothetical protein
MSPSRIDAGYPVKHFSASQGVAVYQRKSGKYLLVPSISQFDPEQKWCRLQAACVVVKK